MGGVSFEGTGGEGDETYLVRRGEDARADGDRGVIVGAEEALCGEGTGCWDSWW